MAEQAEKIVKPIDAQNSQGSNFGGLHKLKEDSQKWTKIILMYTSWNINHATISKPKNLGVSKLKI